MKRIVWSIFLAATGAMAQPGLIPIGGPVITGILPAPGQAVIPPSPANTAAVNSLISVYGSALASSSASAAYPWPSALADTTLTIDNVPCPLSYAGPSQVNALIPAQFEPGTHRLTLKIRWVKPARI